MPVDEWGIRVADDKCTPVGASVERGGATNSPAAVYALTKYIDWMKKYAPPQAMGMTFSESGPVPAQGHIAQQIFWYTAFTADMTKKGLPVVNEDGTPKRSEEHTSELQSLMRISYAVFCLTKQTK